MVKNKELKEQEKENEKNEKEEKNNMPAKKSRSEKVMDEGNGQKVGDRRETPKKRRDKFGKERKKREIKYIKKIKKIITVYLLTETKNLVLILPALPFKC